MKYLIVGLLGVLLQTGCGATYTRLERDRTVGTAGTTHSDCPDGIDYKTGHCQ